METQSGTLISPFALVRSQGTSTFTSSSLSFINLNSRPDIMEKLWCCRNNTMAALKDPNHNHALIPCIGRDCEKWRDGPNYCLHLVRVEKGRRI